MKQRIVIAGGTGSLGKALVNRYKNSDTELVILTRTARQGEGNISYVQWDAKTSGAWEYELEGATAVINLVGKSVNCRYTEENKKEIIASRVDSTLAIGAAISRSKTPPAVWINAGSAAIFGNSGILIRDEDSPLGAGFSPEVYRQWEKAFWKYSNSSTRKVFLRIGLVLQSEGGVMQPFRNLARFGFGGNIGSGDQYITWIHEEDFLNVIDWVIRKEDVSGILHCASPEPVKNREFMRILRKSCFMPFGLPNPGFLVKIGAVVIGTEAELVLSGRKVVSKILREKHFRFRYSNLEKAVLNLTGKR
jgi:uncharacterized protein